MIGPLAKRIKYTSSLKKRFFLGSTLMLTSMLDILTAILFFLLQSFATVNVPYQIAKDIKLPKSGSPIPPQPSLQLMVTQKSILLDNKEVAQIIDGKIPPQDLWKDGLTIVRLAQALKEHRERAMYIQRKGEEKEPFAGLITLQADKDLPFSLIKRVIYTFGMQDFVNLKIATLKKEL